MPTYTCSCGAKYRFADASAGKRSRCKHCGAIFTLPTSADDLDRAIPLSGEHDAADEDHGAIAVSQEPSHASEIVFDPQRNRAHMLVVQDDFSNERTYLGDIARAFIFFGKPADLVTFAFILLVMFFAQAMRMGGCYGLVIVFIVTCWYCAYRFEIIADAASGETNLADLSNSMDVRSEFIPPLLNWITSWLVAMAPAILYVAFRIWQGTFSLAPGSTTGEGLVALVRMAERGRDFPLFLLLLAGAFVWPLIVLCVALGGFACVFAVEPFARTLFQTLPGYALTVLIVFSSDVVRTLLPNIGSAAEWFDTPIRVYFDIVSMRAIGLYYYHFKRDFAYAWE